MLMKKEKKKLWKKILETEGEVSSREHFPNTEPPRSVSVFLERNRNDGADSNGGEKKD